MSPEQALGESLDERSDLFSLGTTFYYLFSGQLPFEKSSPAAVLVDIAQNDAPRLRDTAPHLPIPLTVVIGRLMARNREERYQDVAVVLEDLVSYERRGLLTFADAAALAGPHARARGTSDHETQAYHAPRKDGSGV
jgi:serine/threonine protein kinase